METQSLIGRQRLPWGKPITRYRLPHTDFRRPILTYIRRLWQDEWDLQVHNKLHDIRPVIGFNKYTSGLSRRDQVVLTRCRIGHSRLTHKFILDGGVAPDCVACADRFSLKHILVDCVDFADIRQMFYTVDSMSNLFDNVAGDVVISYLKAIGLYHKI